MARVAIVVGSESDRQLGGEAEALLRELGVDCELTVRSAHRDPRALEEYLKASDASVYIAIAGLSAALPGFIASRTLRPVIGVPRSVKLGGVDALLSTVQMPTGVPVACVGIDAPKNAALLAAEILALGDAALRGRLEDYRRGWSARTAAPRT